jgi:hypothetical protein
MLDKCSMTELYPSPWFFETGSPYVSPGWPGTHYIAKTDLKLTILLPLPTECWDCRWAPLSTGISREHHQAWQKTYFFLLSQVILMLLLKGSVLFWVVRV